jgi:hypothetical protein
MQWIPYGSNSAQIPATMSMRNLGDLGAPERPSAAKLCPALEKGPVSL